MYIHTRVCVCVCACVCACACACACACVSKPRLCRCVLVLDSMPNSVVMHDHFSNRTAFVLVMLHLNIFCSLNYDAMIEACHGWYLMMRN